MRVIICGSRHIKDYEAVKQAIKASGFNITEVVSGKAKGVDTLGEKWADENGIPVKHFPANWDKYGKKSAGPIRNEEMAVYASSSDCGGGTIAIWDGKSTGTKDMVDRSEKRGLKVFVFLHTPKPKMPLTDAELDRLLE